MPASTWDNQIAFDILVLYHNESTRQGISTNMMLSKGSGIKVKKGKERADVGEGAKVCHKNHNKELIYWWSLIVDRWNIQKT
jgi:hypothetical protein